MSDVKTGPRLPPPASPLQKAAIQPGMGMARPEPFKPEPSADEAAAAPESPATEAAAAPKQPVRKALSSATVWKDKPQYPDQISATEEVRQIRLDVHVLDLTKPEDLVKYQALLNLEYDPMSSQHVVTQERRFDEKRGGYIAYVEVAVFQFKQILPDNLHGKPPSSYDTTGDKTGS